jgi:hypothetical protein
VLRHSIKAKGDGITTKYVVTFIARFRAAVTVSFTSKQLQFFMSEHKVVRMCALSCSQIFLPTFRYTRVYPKISGLSRDEINDDDDDNNNNINNNKHSLRSKTKCYGGKSH